MIFTLRPDSGASMACKPSVDAAKYGGFEQRAGSINSDLPTWTLRFTRDAAAALAFVKARNGSESFTWTNPLGEPGLYVCREWKLNHIAADVYALACDFERVMG